MRAEKISALVFLVLAVAFFTAGFTNFSAYGSLQDHKGLDQQLDSYVDTLLVASVVLLGLSVLTGGLSVAFWMLERKRERQERQVQ